MRALKDQVMHIWRERDTNRELHVDIVESKKREASRRLDALYDEWHENFQTDLELSLHYKEEAAQATVKVIERKEQENVANEAAKTVKLFNRLKKEEIDRRENAFHASHRRLVREVREGVEQASVARLNETMEQHKQGLRSYL